MAEGHVVCAYKEGRLPLMLNFPYPRIHHVSSFCNNQLCRSPHCCTTAVSYRHLLPPNTHAAPPPPLPPPMQHANVGLILDEMFAALQASPDRTFITAEMVGVWVGRWMGTQGWGTHKLHVLQCVEADAC